MQHAANKQGAIKMRKETARFTAISDSGKKYTIVKYQDVINIGTMDDPHATTLGMPSYRLASDDSPVNLISAEELQIVKTDEIVRKIT